MNFDTIPWELYDLDEDFSQAHDLAAKNPDKLRELKALFDEEAKKNQVFPLDAQRAVRFDAPGRPRRGWVHAHA